MWLEQRPAHKGYLEENKKRKLNCFERRDFKLRKEPTEEKYNNKQTSSY